MVKKIAISDETQESDKVVTTSSKIDKELGKGIACMLSYVIVDYPLLFVRECPILFYFYDNIC